MIGVYCCLRFLFILLSPLPSSSKNLRALASLPDQSSEKELVFELSKRMKPRNFFAETNANFTAGILKDFDERRIFIPKIQFFHLHHMKSGGTSLNGFLNCGLSRASKFYNVNHTQSLYLSRARLSECSYSSFRNCIEDPEDRCRTTIPQVAYAEFCAPLSATKMLGWDASDAVTMLRHPIDRVWSMFRFQTKSCFKCKNLTEVYEIMDTIGTNASGTEFGGGVCLSQLTNHMTRNLQSTIDNDDWNAKGEDTYRLDDALHNLKNRFTVVGLLERLEESIKLLTHSFPWLEPNLEGSDTVCNYPKLNSSPSNNRCGKNGEHWDLPSKPDEETMKAILKHNQLDIKLYEAAVLHFELQMKVIQGTQDDM